MGARLVFGGDEVGRERAGRSEDADRRDHRDDGRATDAVAVPADQVTVTYRPERDGDPDPGEVVWTWVPYEDDPQQGKDRPVVVIGVAGADLVVVPLSSKDHEGRRDADEWVSVGRGPWGSGDRVSHADLDRLLRVAPAVVRREGATLDRGRFDAVVAAARSRHPGLSERPSLLRHLVGKTVPECRKTVRLGTGRHSCGTWWGRPSRHAAGVRVRRA